MPTFTAKLLVEDKANLEQLKHYHRETLGDTVHWLIVAELGRRGQLLDGSRAPPTEVPA